MLPKVICWSDASKGASSSSFPFDCVPAPLLTLPRKQKSKQRQLPCIHAPMGIRWENSNTKSALVALSSLKDLDLPRLEEGTVFPPNPDHRRNPGSNCYSTMVANSARADATCKLRKSTIPLLDANNNQCFILIQRSSNFARSREWDQDNFIST